MVKKIIYNEKTREFTIKSPLIIDPMKSWNSEFKRVVSESLRSGLYIEIPLGIIKYKAPIAKIGFYERAITQLYALWSLRYDVKTIVGLCGGYNNDLFTEVHNRVIQLYSSTITSLNKLRKDPYPPGHEQLKRISIDKKLAYSIESYGSHRIIYLPKSPYFIKVVSLMFHYDDEPRDMPDRILNNYVNDLFEFPKTQKDYQRILIKFGIELDKHFKD